MTSAHMPLEPEGILRGNDGVFRWVAEINLWRSTIIIRTILLILGAIVLGLGTLLFFLILPEGLSEAWSFFWQFVLFGWLLALVLTALGYALYAAIQGGKYSVVFEMDEQQIRHIQIARSFRKNQVLAMLTMLSGAFAGDPAVAGAGMLASSRQSMTSTFRDVRRIAGRRQHGVIYIRERLDHNQVYVTDDQYDFVYNYLTAHCPKAKISVK